MSGESFGLRIAARCARTCKQTVAGRQQRTLAGGVFHKLHNRGHDRCATRGPVTNKMSTGGGSFPWFGRERRGLRAAVLAPRRLAVSVQRLPACPSACPVPSACMPAPPLLVPRLVLVRVPSAALAAAAQRRPLARRRRARGTALACARGGVKVRVTIRVRVRVQVTMTLTLTLPCGIIRVRSR